MADMLIMRHGEAAPGYPDQARRLTPHGEQEAEKMACWLAERVSAGELFVPRVYASPYARAQQTAQIISDALGVSLQTLNFITPDDPPSAVSGWLLEQPEGTPIMLVSHMPLVGELAGLLVEGSPAQGVGFPTAAIAEFEAEVWAAGCAQLTRFTQPSQLP
ncbi:MULTISPECIES: phosphohistidine phosphatase SixA [unclassified Halomonas]|uniref:phosphohistidine phosphatase SixA n=1 Tax=unclassified Halomonas TaxID=2609666 RepID=UPI0007D9B8BB|nr:MULTISPECIES: phosphohistidine phosphatase SixA [unclassified Halomonas]MBT2787459.1 phosphohistidine phosphatase SixA [Halomonas sp. ISL-106]MBT2796179.1 phosphohistidine phosphatase SixA [Halomonas sp. ISL-104]OAL57663.1 phosphohistidine phosphatase SixA [Halomonas sp. ALS9]